MDLRQLPRTADELLVPGKPRGRRPWYGAALEAFVPPL